MYMQMYLCGTHIITVYIYLADLTANTNLANYPQGLPLETCTVFF